jgi:hypothetical protein
MAIIGGQLVKVIDASATGLCVEKKFQNTHALMTLVLYPSDGVRLNLNKGVRGTGVIVRETDQLVGIKFDPPSLMLAKFISEIVFN